MSSLRAFRPAAVIFDLDGTIVDNMRWHAQAFDAFVTRHGLPPMDAAMRARTDGKRNREIFPLIFGRDLALHEIAALEDEKEGLYRQLSRARLAPLSGLVALLDRLGVHGIAAGVATSGPRENVAHTLAEIGLADRFQAIARGDQVAHGKPAPDVFLYAASQLGVDPARCLAFEDAPVGVAAARRAGMWCAGVTTSYTAAQFEAADHVPHAVFADFEEYLGFVEPWVNPSPVAR